MNSFILKLRTGKILHLIQETLMKCINLINENNIKIRIGILQEDMRSVSKLLVVYTNAIFSHL